MELLAAASWREFRKASTGCTPRFLAATRNRFLMQIMDNILADRRAVLFDGKDTEKRAAPLPVRQQTWKELSAIVDAIASRDAKRAQALVSDHLMRTLATINIWQ
jgi:DNA-binding GntR family transcriptional regulator